MIDTSFEVPGYDLDSIKYEGDVINPFDVIKELDSRIEILNKELNEVKLDRDRLKVAVDLISVYLKNV